MKSKDGIWTYVTVDPNNYNPDIYQDGAPLAFNTGAVEEDPYYDSDTGELLFWSNDRPGADAGVESI